LQRSLCVHDPRTGCRGGCPVTSCCGQRLPTLRFQREDRDGRVSACHVRGNALGASVTAFSWHDTDDGARLWLLDSGTGWFGHADLARGRFERVGFYPGYSRGLAFHGRFAVIGLSKPRENRTFTGLPLDDELTRRDAQARCGLMVVDLRTGDAVHWLRLEGMVEELYDVAVLPGVRRPMAIGLKTDEIRRTITVGEPVPLTP
jgi:uncharacterized protein (TIGR03032 family)